MPHCAAQGARGRDVPTSGSCPHRLHAAVGPWADPATRVLATLTGCLWECGRPPTPHVLAPGTLLTFPSISMQRVSSEHRCCSSNCGCQSRACARGWICWCATTGALGKKCPPLPWRCFSRWLWLGRSTSLCPVCARSQVSLPASIGALGGILLPVSHQLIRKQWPRSAPASPNSVADGFKLTLAALSQSRASRAQGIGMWDPAPCPVWGKEERWRAANRPGRRCLSSDVPLIQEAMPHPQSARLPAGCRCSDEKRGAHFSADQPGVCVSWMEAAA